MVSQGNLTNSLCQERPCPTIQPSLTLVLACMDIAAFGFWGGRFEKAFLDVRVFNPCAQSNRQVSLSSAYRRHEQKKSLYEQRVREVEHSTFTPLVMSTTGEMGRAATTFFKRLYSFLVEREEEGLLQQDHGLDSPLLEFCPSESLYHVDHRSQVFCVSSCFGRATGAL